MITKPGRNCPATRETTKKQGERLDAALEEIELLTHSMDEIEGMMPHLDGTPLEQEPCVKALRKLIEDLYQIKDDSTAQMDVLREKAEYQQKDASLGEELVQAVKGGGGSRERSIDAVDEVLKRRMSEFEIIDADLGALHNRSSKLIKEVDVQKKLFEKATAKAKSYGARQEYFKKLLHGAEELVELHAGLKEGCNFYAKILNQLRRAMQEASQISDQRRRSATGSLRRRGLGRTTTTTAAGGGEAAARRAAGAAAADAACAACAADAACATRAGAADAAGATGPGAADAARAADGPAPEDCVLLLRQALWHPAEHGDRRVPALQGPQSRAGQMSVRFVVSL